VYSVSLDGASADIFNGSQIATRPEQLLYLASGLQKGQHTITIVNMDGRYMDIDYAIISQYGVEQDAVSPPVGKGALPGTNHSTSHQRALIGGVVGGVSLILLGFLIFYWQRRRLLQGKLKKQEASWAIEDGPAFLPNPDNHRPLVSRTHTRTSVLSSYKKTGSGEHATTFIPNGASGASFFPSLPPRKARLDRVDQSKGRPEVDQTVLQDSRNSIEGAAPRFHEEREHNQIDTLRVEVDRLWIALAATNPPAYETH
jgi:hypothetical protein